MPYKKINTNLEQISALAEANHSGNEAFRDYLKLQDAGTVDTMVFQLNAEVSAAIDCTQCGNCCRSLMINVSTDEAERLSAHLQMDMPAFKTKYIEESEGGKMLMNRIPCAFLENNKCNVYEHRFSGCREFPHLDRPGFTGRLFGTMMYYGTCPIIFNVVEMLKEETGFHQPH